MTRKQINSPFPSRKAGYVAYYRVSSTRQGQSGLGLDAQRQAIARLAKSGPILAEYTEIESAKSHKNRPQLLAAMAESKRRAATLLIAKLDRLARNVHFVSGLMESGVDFVAADMPEALPLTLHIFAAKAEHERRMISQERKPAWTRPNARSKPMDFVSAGEAGGLTRNMETRIGNRRLKPQTERGGNRNK